MPTIDCQLHLDDRLPADFKPKAAFALKSLLSAFFMHDEVHLSPNEVPRPEPGRDAITLHIYYGPAPQAQTADVSIQSGPNAPLFFQYDAARALTPADITYINSGKLPLLFGAPEEAATPDSGVMRADIVASAFYFLADWEAVSAAPEALDAHGRVSYGNTLQGKLELAERPIVSEYADLLLQQLNAALRRRLGDSAPVLKPRKWGNSRFGACITHDFDRIKKRSLGTLKRELFDIPLVNPHGYSLAERRRRLRESLRDLFSAEDGYQRSIRRMFEIEKKLGIKPTVLLKSMLPGPRDPHDAADYLDDGFLDEIITNVRNLNGEIGLHASYQAGFDTGQVAGEARQLSQRLNGAEIRAHRFHYLRYEHFKAESMLQQAGIRVDSSLGWAGQPGFRSGFTQPHFMYDHVRNQTGRVLQVPLHMMELQLLGSVGGNPADALAYAKRQAERVKKHGGILCWNFHHHTFDAAEAASAGF
ncbi:MAG: DUF7033 domain-containing protein, partial [Cyclonatronaceae bacterium]